MIYHDLRHKALQYVKAHEITVDSSFINDHFYGCIVQGGGRKSVGVCLKPKGEGSKAAAKSGDLADMIGTNYCVHSRAAGVAAINALGQHAMAPGSGEKNLRELLSTQIMHRCGQKSRIVFIGHLEPVVAKLRQNGYDPQVFCRQRVDTNARIYNDIYEYEAISKADMVIITGASLIGSTIDAMLAFTRPRQTVILAGFSAGAYPGWYKNTGVDYVASIDLGTCTKAGAKALDMAKVFAYPAYFEKIG